MNKHFKTSPTLLSQFIEVFLCCKQRQLAKCQKVLLVVGNNDITGASRRPKYGYARDRYGRVQERDSLNEDRKNEFKLAQSRHKNYDYSSYDAEDDHDSYYDSDALD